jgi:outer membrane receptor protein involved in Fe transport
MTPFALVLMVLPAHAAKPVDPFDEPSDAELYRAEERVVTVATRYAQTVAQAPNIVTVLTDREIRTRGYRTLSDLLRSMPGIYVTTAQESRGLAWFRGVASPDNNKFLLLIDGVPLYDGVYTHAWIDSYVPLVDVKQVEVIKGPGSAVYGTNAFAGVVNIVTYRAADLQGGFARIEAGSFGRRGAAGVLADRFTLGTIPVEVRATARALELDGDGMDITPSGKRNTTGLNPSRALLGRFGLKIADLDLSWTVFDYRHTYFVNPQDDPLSIVFQDSDTFFLAYRDQLASARYDIRLGSFGRIRPEVSLQVHDDPGQYAFLGDPATTVDPTTGEATTALTGTLVETEKRTSRIRAGVDASLQPTPAHTTLVGVGSDILRIQALEDREFVDFSPEPVTPSAFAVRDKDAQITNFYGFLQHTWTSSYWLELTAGARVDQHTYFGTFVSPRAGVLLVPSQNLVVKILYGRAFRAPTARELLVDVGMDENGENRFVAGNPDLQPEVIDTVESEATATPIGGLTLRGAGFYSAVGQEINSVVGNNPKLGTHFYDNGGTTTIYGGEAQAAWDSGRLLLDSTYSFTKAVVGDTNRDQYGVPQHMLNSIVSVEPLDGLRLSVLSDFFGTRPRSEWTPDSKRPDGPPVHLLHAAVATDALANGRVRADLSIRNLLDTQYTDLVYRNDANATNLDPTTGAVSAKYPEDIGAEGRAVTVGVEVSY